MAQSLAFQLAQNGATSELAALLQAGEVTADAIRLDGMYKGYSLLHTAAAKGHTSCVEQLLSAGAQVDVCNAQGKTPLMMASDKGHADIVALLQAAGSGFTSASPPPPEPPVPPPPAAASGASVSATTPPTTAAELPSLATNPPTTATELSDSLSALDLSEDVLEAKFDEHLERAVTAGKMSQTTADQMTDEVAAGTSSTARCEIMRRLLGSGGAHDAEQPPPQPQPPREQRSQRSQRPKAAQQPQSQPGSAQPDSKAATPPPEPNVYGGMGLDQMYSVRLQPSAPPAPPQVQTFERYESVKGERINTLAGLALHREVLSPAEQMQTLHYARQLCDLGDDGELCGRTYSAPRKWMRGKGRITVQMGCCYNYARDKQGNPPGILPREPVCGMPPFLHDIIDRMVSHMHAHICMHAYMHMCMASSTGW